MNFKTSREKLYIFSFVIIISWFKVSKALEKSINIAETHSPLSITFFHFSNIIIKECCVPCDFLKQVYNSPSTVDLIPYKRESPRKVLVLEESYYAEKNNFNGVCELW